MFYLTNSAGFFKIDIWYMKYAIHLRACTGFDRDLEDGEAIRRQMRQIANLKLNANDNFELAAA